MNLFNTKTLCLVALISVSYTYSMENVSSRFKSNEFARTVTKNTQSLAADIAATPHVPTPSTEDARVLNKRETALIDQVETLEKTQAALIEQMERAEINAVKGLTGTNQMAAAIKSLYSTK